MKSFLNMALILLLLSSATLQYSQAAEVAKKMSKKNLSTSFKFEGSTLRGKYQTSLGTNTTVENDKYLDDLLVGRKNFDDRIKVEKERN